MEKFLKGCKSLLTPSEDPEFGTLQIKDANDRVIFEKSDFPMVLNYGIDHILLGHGCSVGAIGIENSALVHEAVEAFTLEAEGLFGPHFKARTKMELSSPKPGMLELIVSSKDGSVESSFARMYPRSIATYVLDAYARPTPADVERLCNDIVAEIKGTLEGENLEAATGHL